MPRKERQALGQHREGHWPLQWLPSTAVILAWWQREPLRAFPAGLQHGGVTLPQPQEPDALEGQIRQLLSKFGARFFTAFPRVMRAKGVVCVLIFFPTNFFIYLK